MFAAIPTLESPNWERSVLQKLHQPPYGWRACALHHLDGHQGPLLQKRLMR
jgi:hypothetical protein